MSDYDDSDRIDRWLREDARRTLADDGFSARVLAALPAPRVRPQPWLKPLLVIGSAALGSALAVLLAPGGLSVAQGFIDLATLRGMTPAAVTGIALSVTLLASALVLALEAD